MTPAELESYQVSTTHGFLPSEPPLGRLPQYFEEWEIICSNLPALISKNKLAQAVAQLPLLSTTRLESEPEWKRAYVLLGFIANGYIWGSGKAIDRLPTNISVPFVAASTHLGLPPYPTIAGQNLWNYKLLNPEQPMANPANLLAQQSFTGTDDESWFYVVVTAIEARGAPIIPLALQAFDKVSMDDFRGVAYCLQEISIHLRGLSEVLPRMYERCDPQFFYNNIRPFLAGSKGSSELLNGVFYEDEIGGGEFRQCIGPTAAQSPLLQFIDLTLGVRHSRTRTTSAMNDPTEQDAEFLQAMRQHMPGPHRQFLQHVSETSNIRAYVTSRPSHIALHAAYNQCLEALVAFRNKHIQVVSRYVVLPSRAAAQRDQRSAKDSTTSAKDMAPLGTGGTAPIHFLKQVRNETKETFIDEPSKISSVATRL